MAILHKVLVAIDGSDASLKATEFAAMLAKNKESEVVFLHVLDHAETTKRLEKEVKPVQKLPEPVGRVFLQSVLSRMIRKYEPTIARNNVKHSEQIVVGKPVCEDRRSGKEIRR